MIVNAYNPLRLDPSRTSVLRRSFMGELRRRFDRIKRAVKEFILEQLGVENALAANAPAFRFLATPEQLEAFKRWLKRQIKEALTGKTEDELWRKYVEQGFKQGQARAWDDFKSSADPEYLGKTPDFYQGSREEFLRSSFRHPVSVERVKVLASRVFTELEDVTAGMARKMSRVLTDGLVKGDSPRTVARDLAAEVDISKSRAERIARTETVRAHSEGQLKMLEDLGVEELGIMVEWTVSGLGVTRKGFPSPCPRCAKMKGVVLPIAEAHGLLPLHPNCLCTFVPANVGEDRRGQKRGQAARRAISEAQEV